MLLTAVHHRLRGETRHGNTCQEVSREGREQDPIGRIRKESRIGEEIVGKAAGEESSREARPRTAKDGA